MATCPICNSEAEQIEPGAFDGKTFRCPKHGEFDVAHSVLNTMMNASAARWEVALAKAASQAAEGKRPRITTYDFWVRWCPRCGQVEIDVPVTEGLAPMRPGDPKCAVPQEEWMRATWWNVNRYFADRFPPLPGN